MTGSGSNLRGGARAALLAWSIAWPVAWLAAAGGPALAASAAQPGQTVGLPVGAQLPVGLYVVNLSSFGVRGTRPRDSATNVNLPTFAWATPWTVAGARLQFFFTQPVAAASAQGAPYQSGIGQPLLAAQLAWDLGGDLGVSYLFGGYLPIETRFLTQSASLSHRFAASYTGNDWNLTANLLYGVFLDTRSPLGTLYPDYLNLDLTATRKFGRWQVGAVAFGSTDLPTGVARYRPQGQIAVGGLVGYNFGPVNLQAYVTHDVVERNYGGREIRGWLRVIVPLYQDKGEVEPNRTLVTRRQAE
ncbi:hypothetical protein GCM10007886_43840 [Methylobacterium gregans]|uniref:CoxB-like protein n=1 Tax=Methylobacterium gregans TaxID=374424 RepID=A0AA37HJQ0_9HYPH|nr:transporter [Methylobacterium gregans]MDQ0519679.1 hypothetical protein [Methylobacterium gregans]GJD76838.1 hypothetical protein NBEOAGPD_0039 [Methylobacterium gregans]GLS56199.1 hypothetical protein GCM10007886_43840 [Methylobacterium gregans]